MDKTSKNEGQGKPWWEGRKFKHPETGHDVKFLSLPTEEQKKLNLWVKENAPEKFVTEVMEKSQPPKEEPLPTKEKPEERKAPSKKKVPSKEEGQKKLDDTIEGKNEETRSLAKSLFSGMYDTNPEHALKLIHLLERYEEI